MNKDFFLLVRKLSNKSNLTSIQFRFAFNGTWLFTQILHENLLQRFMEKFKTVDWSNQALKVFLENDWKITYEVLLFLQIANRWINVLFFE